MKRIEVAVAVIVNQHGQVLIAKRPEHLHQGGKWEYPGGKIETGESVHQAMVREIREELALELGESEELITLDYEYSDKHVRLCVRWTEHFEGEARGMEGQEVRWVDWQSLEDYRFPDANLPILTAIEARLGA
ncbi:8-oxo-dGTP diphosphatase MutT [Paraferrimonas sedimenticola]|uniref:8-oxo-dGTP diphosphatase n=1 Tax=Paraferrimonas sedimenticola TaxID=375674 RepID=A0AA37RY75_9GAMM|nr:8-oxo-dGTP diphosphatase MutT [Paraferrimonas sedimenticola]GLP97489.1 7,8-dihydro-8-oxoguanine-triphosphatase [Paraferrimonas sedimenticola]